MAGISTALKRVVDWPVLLPAAALSLAGLVFIGSAGEAMGPAGSGFASRQAIWMLIGLGAYAATVVLGLKRLLRLAPALFAGACLALVLVLRLGSASHGARRWFAAGPIAVQPSEFAKVAFLLFFAAAAARLPVRRVGGFLALAALAAAPAALVAAEPDLGTALVFLPVAGVMLWTAGARARHLALCVLLAALVTPLAWSRLKPYQRGRILAFLHPEAAPLAEGYQLLQSKEAVGSGGLFGRGLGRGTHNALNLLPERHTDFIFSVVAEEGGFVGATLVILGLFWLVFTAASTALSTPSLLGAALAAGVAALLAFQTTVNAGMACAVMPITGLPLPFLTYGGSSHLACWLACGLLSAVRLTDAENLVESPSERD